MSHPSHALPVIWITGASSGIGKALALAYSPSRVRLIVSARRENELKAVAEMCLKKGASDVRVLPFDLGASDSLPSIVAEAMTIHGHIDTIIHSGGISQRSRASETTLSVDRRIMEVNYFGTVALTKAILPFMLERRSGHIVVVSSLMGKFGTPFRSGYAASKHALHGFFDSLRSEVQSQGISITLLCPGFVKTEISMHALEGDGRQHERMDEKQAQGLSTESFARQALKHILARRSEVYIGGREIWGITLKRFFPKLFERIIAQEQVV